MLANLLGSDSEYMLQQQDHSPEQPVELAGETQPPGSLGFSFFRSESSRPSLVLAVDYSSYRMGHAPWERHMESRNNAVSVKTHLEVIRTQRSPIESQWLPSEEKRSKR